MRTLDSAQSDAVRSVASKLTLLFELTLANGTVLYLTPSDRDIIVGSMTYSAIGCDVSTIDIQLGTSPASFTLDIALTTSELTLDMVEAGLCDYAGIVTKVFDFTRPAMAPIVYHSGIVSASEAKDDYWVELTIDPILHFDFTIAQDVFQTNCRVDFGSPKCGVDINSAANKKTFTVAAITNRQQFTTDLTDIDDYYDFGMVVFSSGNNAGTALELATYKHTGGTITLRLVTPFVLAPGDTGTVYRGCDLTILGGCTKYANIVNFRGEPFVVDPTAQSSTSTTAATTAPPVPPTPTYQLATRNVTGATGAAIYWNSASYGGAILVPVRYPGQVLNNAADIAMFYAYCDSKGIARGTSIYVWEFAVNYYIYPDGRLEGHRADGSVFTVTT